MSVKRILLQTHLFVINRVFRKGQVNLLNEINLFKYLEQGR